MDIRNAQLARVIYLFELRLVVDHAAVLTEIFHALGQGNAVALAEVVEVAHQRRALVKLDFAYRLELRRCGKLGLGQVLSLEQKLSDCIICGCVVAPFGQQRAVVVARDRRLIFFVAVRSGSEAEVRATVEHVEIEARVDVKKIFNLARNAVRAASVMFLAPVVEPAAPELGAHLRGVLMESVHGVEYLGRARTEVQRLEHIGERAAGEHAVVVAVGGEEHNLCAAVEHQLFDISEIFLVVAVAAVFVLDLHRDYVAALALLKIADLLKQPVIEVRNMLQIFGIGAAQTHVSVLEQPCRQPAEVPFRADIRTGSDYRIEPDLLRRLDKTPDVEPAGEVKFALPRLMHVPADICFNRVETRRLELSEPVLPVFGHDAEIVHRARIYAKALAVHFKLAVFYSEHLSVPPWAF